MTPLVMFGVDARQAALDARAPFALTPDQADAAVRRLAACQGVREALVLSTCNRTEVYLVADRDWDAGWFAAAWPGQPVGDVPVIRHGAAAVAHLYRVVCGLEATLLGDTHIVGQVRDAYARSVTCGTAGPIVHHLCQQAFRTAKRVRHDTALGAGRVTLGGVVTHWIDERGVPVEARVAVLGSGGLAVDVARHLSRSGRRVTLVSRDAARAARVAGSCGAQPAVLAAVKDWLVDADVLVGATRATQPVIGVETVSAARRGRGWPVIVDLGVPRNFDAPGLVLATVDDMVGRMDGARAARVAAVPAALALIATAVEQWQSWTRLRARVPEIVALLERAAGAECAGSPQGRQAQRAALHRQVVQVRRRAQTGLSGSVFRHAAA